MTKEFSTKEDEHITEEHLLAIEEGSQIIMGPPSTTLVLKRIRCPVCPIYFHNSELLQYHIRSIHFNLKAKTKSYDDKKINQIWHEKVLNTTKIVEMKKVSNNLFLIRKLEDDAEVNVLECDRVLDLSDLYPTNRLPSFSKCRICFKRILNKDLQKHYDEQHDMQKQNHTCNFCNKTFKRSVPFRSHACNSLKTKKRKLIL